MKHFYLFSIVFCFLAAAFSAPGILRAEGADVSLSTLQAVYHAGQEFAIDILLQPTGTAINAIEGTVTLPAGVQFTGSDDSHSFISLWIKRPTESNGAVVFSGVVPSGWSGLINPLDSSRMLDGTVIRLYFTAQQAGTFAFIGSARAYANDGLGTEVPIGADALSVAVDSVYAPSKISVADVFPPLPFTPLLIKDKTLASGKYAVVFATEDKESGIDHYEVKQGNFAWTIAESPYVLPHQWFRNSILVRAIDRAGNIQEAQVESTAKNMAWLIQYGIMSGIALILVIILACIFSHRTFTKRRKKYHEKLF